MNSCSDIKWTFVWINLLNGQFAQVYCLWDSIMYVYFMHIVSPCHHFGIAKAQMLTHL